MFTRGPDTVVHCPSAKNRRLEDGVALSLDWFVLYVGSCCPGPAVAPINDGNSSVRVI